MTNLPAQINLYNLTFNTFGLFMLFGFILLAYVFWKEGKGDGFDEERLFDLLLISLISSLFFSRLFFAISAKISFLLVPTHIAKFWTPGHNMLGAFAGLILAIYILCKIWNWSVYRILDIFALGLSLGLSVILLGYVGLQAKFEFLFAFAAFIFLFAILSKIRNLRIKSGYSFSVFCLISAGLGLVFAGQKEHLIFYTSLVTLSSVVFLFRAKKASYEPKHIGEYISKIKSSLRAKRKTS